MNIGKEIEIRRVPEGFRKNHELIASLGLETISLEQAETLIGDSWEK